MGEKHLPLINGKFMVTKGYASVERWRDRTLEALEEEEET